MHITEEFEFRKAFVKEHSTKPLSDGEAGNKVMAEDPAFYERYRYYQCYKTDPGAVPMKKQEAPSYDAVLAQVTEVAKAKGVPRETVFLEGLHAADGTSEFPALAKAYRQFHLTDSIVDRDAAALAKAESPIFSTAAALSDPRGVVAYVEDVVRTLALTMERSDDEIMQRLKAKYSGLHAAYVEAKNAIPALPANAPTSVGSLKMARR
jgi:hypothetical protein